VPFAPLVRTDLGRIFEHLYVERLYEL